MGDLNNNNNNNIQDNESDINTSDSSLNTSNDSFKQSSIESIGTAFLPHIEYEKTNTHFDDKIDKGEEIISSNQSDDIIIENSQIVESFDEKKRNVNEEHQILIKENLELKNKLNDFGTQYITYDCKNYTIQFLKFVI